MLSEQQVAGTIFARVDDSSCFLVTKQAEEFSFITTNIAEEFTGLASIIQHFKETLNVGIDDLELFELTNIVNNHIRVPLFVFTIRGEAKNPSDIIKQNQTGFTWEKTATLQSDMKHWEISGVPRFDKDK